MPAASAACVTLLPPRTSVRASSSFSMTRDDILEARDRKARMSKATKAKVQADKANAAAAEAWGAKVVRKMEAAGKFG